MLVLGIFGGSAETVTARVAVEIRFVNTVTAEIMAIGRGVSEESQRNVCRNARTSCMSSSVYLPS